MLVQDNKYSRAQVQMHSRGEELYLPGSQIARRLSRVQMILGTKVLFVRPGFGTGPVSLLLLSGMT